MKAPFTKVTPFSLTTFHTWDRDALELLLRQTPYREIGKNSLRSYGFIPAIDGENLVEPVGPGMVYIRFKVTERNLPKSTIKERTDEMAAERELNEGRKLRRPEYMELWDVAVAELIPQAFPKHNVITALLTPTHIFVDTASPKRAEDLVSALRGCIGTLPVQTLTTIREISPSLTGLMLKHEEWDGFDLGERFKAKGTSNAKSVLSGTHMDLGRQELQSLIDGTREVVEMELTWQEEGADHSTWFVLTKDAQLKGIVYPPELSDKVAEECGEDSEAQTVLRATLHMIVDHLQKLVDALAECLGGEHFGAAGERQPCQRSLYEALGTLAEKEGVDRETRIRALDLAALGDLAELSDAARRAFPKGAIAILNDPLQRTDPSKEFVLVEEEQDEPDGGDFSDVDDMI